MPKFITKFAKLAAVSAALCTAGIAPASAEDARSLTIELSSSQPTGDACRFSFLATNAMGTDVQSAVYEAVFFDENGGIKIMTLLDFQSLPAGRPRVRQFDIPSSDCADVSRVLLNGAATCDINGAMSSDCVDKLNLRSQLDQELIG